jgi:hypothetical protein
MKDFPGFAAGFAPFVCRLQPHPVKCKPLQTLAKRNRCDDSRRTNTLISMNAVLRI